jgi:hypothetical protein
MSLKATIFAQCCISIRADLLEKSSNEVLKKNRTEE